jgi:cupin fold WbuC family metalloprotein
MTPLRATSALPIMSESQPQTALHAQAAPVIRRIAAADLTALAASAASAPRLRAHLNVHSSPEAAVQRLFIATEPGTYIRPHRHPEAHKWELFVVLAGEIHLLLFSDDGRVTERIPMSPAATRAVEIPPGTWHSYVCMQGGTLALEVKEGAYIPTPPADFASWSPPEQSPGVPAYLESLRGALPAD